MSRLRITLQRPAGALSDVAEVAEQNTLMSLVDRPAGLFFAAHGLQEVRDVRRGHTAPASRIERVFIALVEVALDLVIVVVIDDVAAAVENDGAFVAMD